MARPIRVPLVLLLLAPCVAGAREATPNHSSVAEGDGPVQNTREIVLDERSAGKVFGIRTARNVLTTVEFPEDLSGRPACGDCEDDQGPEGDALYRMEVSGQGRYLTIRPNPAGRRGRDEDTGTTVLVRMEHATLTLFVDQTERARADTRVVFSYPNRAADSEYLRVERAKIEAEAAAKAETALTARFLRAFAEPHRCETKSARVRSDDIVLEAKEMCSFGREVIITFEIENRGRAPLEVGSVVVNKGSENKREYLSQQTVGNDRPSTGVVAFHLADGEEVRGPYELTVFESGGRGRVISLGRLEF